MPWPGYSLGPGYSLHPVSEPGYSLHPVSGAGVQFILTCPSAYYVQYINMAKHIIAALVLLSSVSNYHTMVDGILALRFQVCAPLLILSFCPPSVYLWGVEYKA